MPLAADAARPHACRPAAHASSLIARGADGLIVPHGGKLVDLMVTDPKRKAALYAECQGRKIELSDRNACDVELLTVGCAPIGV
jgi:sulfate adenylyltransferase